MIQLKIRERDTLVLKLKYEGRSYKEIGEVVGLSETSLLDYFAHDGRLYQKYKEYELEQNQLQRQEAQLIINKEVANIVKIKMTLLKKSLENGENDLANKICNEILEMAGLGGIQRVAHTVFTYEEYLTELQRRGIDPKTGLRHRANRIAKISKS